MALEVIVGSQTGARPAPILFVHGAWHAAWCWQEHFLPYFAARGYATRALSLRGHGASPGRERLRWTRIADYVADVQQVVSELPHPPILVGHSMGGLVVQKYLEDHRMPAAVLLASVPTHGAIKAILRVMRREPRAFLRTNLTLSPYALVDTPHKARVDFFSPDLAPELVDKYTKRLQDESYVALLDMTLFNLPVPRKVTTPLLVLGGATDQFFDPSEIEKTAWAYRTHADILPNMAHDMMLEPRWETAAARIAAWLEEKEL